ncbi:MAG TPA: hypothetical protein VMM13_21125 [Euzebya sp.]|nr:hypothetical protein [Euzebya sp.]
MGWLDDMKEDIAEARDARDMISPVPAQRIDTVVADPVSGERRHRTDYAGTVWYGGRPQMGRPLPGALTEITTSVWLPDSHRYAPGAAGDAQVQASAAVQSAWIQSTGGGLQIFEVSAALGEDPQNSGVLLVYLAVNAAANLPLGLAYRVTVICAPEALRPPAA